MIDHDRPDIADPGDRARQRKIIGVEKWQARGRTAELLTGIEEERQQLAGADDPATQKAEVPGGAATGEAVQDGADRNGTSPEMRPSVPAGIMWWVRRKRTSRWIESAELARSVRRWGVPGHGSAHRPDRHA